MSGPVLILGASSGIATALARTLAAAGYDLVLAGRRQADLDRAAADLRIRAGVRIEQIDFEALDFESHASIVARAEATIGSEIEGLVLCHGAMVDEALAGSDFVAAREMIEVNFTSPVSILDRAAPIFESRGTGWICVITSVAGDRGRASNYHYGSTKAGLSQYLSGLRVRLARAGVPVIDVRPGPVDTPMTQSSSAKLPLLASPDRVAKDILRGIRRGSAVVYTPPVWRVILFVIRALPEFVFRRLPL